MSKIFHFAFLCFFSILFLFLGATRTYAEIIKVQGSGDFSQYSFELDFFIANSDGEDKHLVENKPVDVVIQAFDNKDGKLVTDLFDPKTKYYFLISDEKRGCKTTITSGNAISTLDNTGDLRVGDHNDLFGHIYPFEKNTAAGVNNLCSKLTKGKYKFAIWPQRKGEKKYLFPPDKVEFEVYYDENDIPAKIDYLSEDELDKSICENRPTQIKLENAKVGEVYTFWWSGAKFITEFATDKPITVEKDADATIVPLTGNGLDSRGGKARICARKGYGAANFNAQPPPITLNCNTKGSFLDFEIPIKGTKVCKDIPTRESCSAKVSLAVDGTNKYKVTAIATNLTPNTSYKGKLTRISDGYSFNEIEKTSNVVGGLTFTFGDNLTPVPAGEYVFEIPNLNEGGKLCEFKPIPVNNLGGTVEPAPEDVKNNCKESKGGCSSAGGEQCSTETGLTKAEIESIADTQKRTAYLSMLDGVKTAVGCVPTRPDRLVDSIMKYATFILGGVALLLMFIASWQWITALGNPDAINKARDQFINAFIGLLFIIFSGLLLQIIGVDILDIPGLS